MTSKTSCSVPGCSDDFSMKRGMCNRHYITWRKHGDPLYPVQRHSGGRTRRPRDTCSVAGCSSLVKCKALCIKHYSRLKAHGDPHTVLIADRGTGHIKAGYRLMFDPTRYRMHPEHRLVMERVLGRQLHRHEDVHHLNGDKLDNRPENLELWSHSQPRGQRVTDKVKHALEVLALYAPERLNSDDGISRVGPREHQALSRV